MAIRRMASIKTADDFRDHAAALGVDLPFDDELEAGPDAPLARPFAPAAGADRQPVRDPADGGLGRHRATAGRPT